MNSVHCLLKCIFLYSVRGIKSNSSLIQTRKENEGHQWTYSADFRVSNLSERSSSGNMYGSRVLCLSVYSTTLISRTSQCGKLSTDDTCNNRHNATIIIMSKL